MARIIGVEIPDNKKIEYSLRYIYGIGPGLAQEILAKAQVDPNVRTKALSDEQLTRITHAITEGRYVLEGDLRREIQQNIRRLMGISSYRGSRHKKGLPVRGQRTSTNARTRKGPRKTVGVVRAKETRKPAEA
jgi:small subunit ribosomal protein S13